MPVTLYKSEDLEERSTEVVEWLRQQLADLLGTVTVTHIGATSVPGALTKGDVDVLAVVSKEAFVNAEALVAGRFVRNEGSELTESFASFKGTYGATEYGIQLLAEGNEAYQFQELVQRLRDTPELLQRYNEIKANSCSGSMDAYRKAKSEFIERTLGTID